MLNKKNLLVLLVLAIGALVLAACAPAAEPQIVTVTVQGADGETTVVTVVVTEEGGNTDGGNVVSDEPIEVGQGNLVACLDTSEYFYVPSGGGEAAGNTAAAPTVASNSSASTFAAMNANAVAAQDGTTYRVGIFSDITTTNYWAANGPDNTVWNSYVLPPRPTLYGLANVTFDFVPSLALNLEDTAIVEDGDFFVSTINMRDDVTWSDGEPVTADDFVFTSNVAITLGIVAGGWGGWFDGGFIDHIEAVDDYTAAIYYHTKPGLSRHQYGTLSAPILAEHFWAPLIDEAGVFTSLEGLEGDELAAAQAAAQDTLYAISADGEPLAGAFLFESWEPGAFAENSANPDFYDNGTSVTYFSDGTYQEAYVSGDTVQYYGAGGGDVDIEYTVGPNVGAAVYSIYGSQDAAILALRDGEIDFLLNPLGLQRGLLDQVEGDENITVIENPTNGMRYLSFNTRRAPMNDCSFRQAIATLIDKEFVASTILQGVAFPLYSFVPEANTAWYSADAPRFGFNQDGTSMTREERINAAVAILEQAGYTWDGNTPSWDPDNRAAAQDPGRLVLPDGQLAPEIELLAPSPGYDPLRSTFAIWVETWLQEVGIPVTANLTGFNVIVQRVFVEQNFDMQILGWSLSIFPDYLYDFFAEEQAVLDGNNAGGYVNADFESLAGQLLTCDNVDDCKVLADEIQVLLSTELPYVVLFDTGIIESYRSASIDFPFTSQLSGLQYSQGIPSLVAVK